MQAQQLPQIAVGLPFRQP